MGVDLWSANRDYEQAECVSRLERNRTRGVEHAQPTFADMLSAGATTLQITEAGEWTTRVLQDPAGNEFCLIGPD